MGSPTNGTAGVKYGLARASLILKVINTRDTYHSKSKTATYHVISIMGVLPLVVTCQPPTVNDSHHYSENGFCANVPLRVAIVSTASLNVSIAVAGRTDHRKMSSYVIHRQTFTVACDDKQSHSLRLVWPAFVHILH